MDFLVTTKQELAYLVSIAKVYKKCLKILKLSSLNNLLNRGIQLLTARLAFQVYMLFGVTATARLIVHVVCFLKSFDNFTNNYVRFQG